MKKWVCTIMVVVLVVFSSACSKEQTEEEKRLDPLNLLGNSIFSQREETLQKDPTVIQFDASALSELASKKPYYYQEIDYYGKPGSIAYGVEETVDNGRITSIFYYAKEFENVEDFLETYRQIFSDMKAQYGDDYSLSFSDSNELLDKGTSLDQYSEEDIRNAYLLLQDEDGLDSIVFETWWRNDKYSPSLRIDITNMGGAASKAGSIRVGYINL